MASDYAKNKHAKVINIWSLWIESLKPYDVTSHWNCLGYTITMMVTSYDLVDRVFFSVLDLKN